jgi:cellulose biosynthesis protein BcsQ
MWWRMRGSPDNPALLPETGKPAKAAAPDVTIIDTPPANLKVIRRAIDLCDVAVIPVRASAFDIAAVKDTIDMCRDARRFLLLVLNASEPRRRELRAETMAALQKLGPTLETPIDDRAAYVMALHHGLTGPEAAAIPGKRSKSAAILDAEGAAEEIKELWAGVLTVLKHARKS